MKTIGELRAYIEKHFDCVPWEQGSPRAGIAPTGDPFVTIGQPCSFVELPPGWEPGTAIEGQAREGGFDEENRRYGRAVVPDDLCGRARPKALLAH